MRIQKTPLLGTLLRKKLNTSFPSNVLYGDIIKGLPFDESSCDGLYCSHTLEHLSLQDLRKALLNSFSILKKGGIFRCIVSDLEHAARLYITELDKGITSASLNFMNSTLLGVKKQPKGVNGFASSFLGNSNHLWMWDFTSLSEELKDVGFSQIKVCSFNDSKDEMFKHVESRDRFKNAVAIECQK